MGNSRDKKNNQQFSHGDLVRLKGDPTLTKLAVCPAPGDAKPADDEWTWVVVWITDPAPAHPNYFLLPTACLVALTPKSTSGD